MYMYIYRFFLRGLRFQQCIFSRMHLSLIQVSLLRWIIITSCCDLIVAHRVFLSKKSVSLVSSRTMCIFEYVSKYIAKDYSHKYTRFFPKTLNLTWHPFMNAFAGCQSWVNAAVIELFAYIWYSKTFSVWATLNRASNSSSYRRGNMWIECLYM